VHFHPLIWIHGGTMASRAVIIRLPFEKHAKDARCQLPMLDLN